ncbi:acyl-CoA thioesterase domain-containing protein [Nocardioides limicola]|uniref:acyl-CoA thioesterase domain-containing protein n=1 Tax=Nocardioides limicola TaxID=2803368 RepID=UPI00193AF863|nr:acyl-CoA thioesterase domain-containing protein [Nocardioides sp. DJM-14]
MPLAFFRRSGDESFLPEPVSCSLWSDDQMHGVAVSALLASSMEKGLATLGRTDLRPAKYAVDLFAPARMHEVTPRLRVVREGKRLCLIDVDLEQDGARVARASGLFLLPTANPDGDIWVSSATPQPPPADIAPETDQPHVPIFASDDTDWSNDFAGHQNPSRKRTWQTGVPPVLGERPTPFTAVASIADAASMVTNWGTHGVTYINTDITLVLSRLPVGLEVGLEAMDRTENDGIAVGTVRVFDRAGVLGSVTVSALANARRAVNLGAHEPEDSARV